KRCCEKFFPKPVRIRACSKPSGEDMQNREDSCFFSAAHAAKDSGIALELARNVSLDLPLARATKEQYDRMIAEDLGDLASPASPSLRSKTAINLRRAPVIRSQSGAFWSSQS